MAELAFARCEILVNFSATYWLEMLGGFFQKIEKLFIYNELNLGEDLFLKPAQSVIGALARLIFSRFPMARHARIT